MNIADLRERVAGATGGADKPVRVQLRRAKGWRMPPNTVKVDRSTPHGNPWRIVGPNEHRRLWWVQGPRADQECSSDAEAVSLSLRKFRYYAEHRPELYRGLRGKNLGCWCRLDQPCHADIWLELANAPVAPEARRSTVSSVGGSGISGAAEQPSPATRPQSKER